MSSSCASLTDQSEGLTRDDILDNITITWLTNRALSGARLYWENKLGYFNAKSVSIPVAVSVFPDELYPAPRSWAERVYPKLIHYNKAEKAGHFAASEQPQLFSEAVRAGLRPLEQARCDHSLDHGEIPTKVRKVPQKVPASSPTGGSSC